MNKNKTDHQCSVWLAERLSDRAVNLDVTTVDRLRAARQQAVCAYQSGQESSMLSSGRGYSGFSGINWRFLVPGMAVSVAALGLGVLLMLAPPVGVVEPVPAGLPVMEAEPGVNELDVLMSNEDMEFLENLEVYEWLAAEYG